MGRVLRDLYGGLARAVHVARTLSSPVRLEAFRSVRRFVFRNPACLPAELVELKSLRPDLQVLVVRWSQQYV